MPMQLDEPSTLPRRAAILWILLAAAYLILALSVASLPPDPLIELPGVALAHSTAMAFVSFVTAVLLLANASRSGNLGYLILAGVFICILILSIAFPLAFPGSLITDEQGQPVRLLGDLQSSISIFYQWHLILYLGLPVSAVFFTLHGRAPRQRLMPIHLTVTVILSVFAGLALAAWDLLRPQTLPVFIGPDGITSLANVADWLLLAIAVGGLIAIIVITRERTVIGRWVTAVAVLSLGEAIVNVGVERYSAGWFFTRVFGLLAMSALLLALVWETARVDRAALKVASRDTLTSVLSRAVFEVELAQEVSQAVRTGDSLALLWIDVDDFKSVNDRFGHRAGDRVLQVISQRISHQIRNSDLLARMGGDEFAVALPGVGSREVAEAVAERIVRDLAVPIEIGTTRVSVSGSIGVAYVPQDATVAEQLSHRADVAMYEAKALGGNRFVAYREGLEERAVASASLRASLLAAIEEEAFEPYAQPIVVAQSRQVVGFEILARWCRAGEVIPAEAFIDLAEGTGLIVPIGQQVRAKALTSLAQLLQAYPDVGFVALNLSLQELRDPTSIAALTGASWGPWADRVVLEVTESEALDKGGPTEQTIDRLRALRYRIAVDDFGVGYSTIVRLEQLLPSIIKADRSLLSRIHASGADPHAMLRWAYDIAGVLDSTLVVEGVETDVEDAAVCTLDGVLAQGYFYGRPAPIREWIARAGSSV